MKTASALLITALENLRMEWSEIAKLTKDKDLVRRINNLDKFIQKLKKEIK